MTERHLAQRFAQKSVQIAPPGDAGKILGVMVLERLDILAVMVRVVEIVAQQPPGLVIDLSPFGRRVGPGLDLRQVHGRLFCRRSPFQGQQRPALARSVEDFSAVRASGGFVHRLEHETQLAGSGQIVPVKRLTRRLGWLP